MCVRTDAPPIETVPVTSPQLPRHIGRDTAATRPARRPPGGAPGHAPRADHPEGPTRSAFTVRSPCRRAPFRAGGRPGASLRIPTATCGTPGRAGRSPPLHGAHRHTSEGPPGSRQPGMTPHRKSPSPCVTHASRAADTGQDIAPGAGDTLGAHSEKPQVRPPCPPSPRSPRTPGDASSGTGRTPGGGGVRSRRRGSRPGRGRGLRGRRRRRRGGGGRGRRGG